MEVEGMEIMLMRFVEMMSGVIITERAVAECARLGV